MGMRACLVRDRQNVQRNALGDVREAAGQPPIIRQEKLPQCSFAQQAFWNGALDQMVTCVA